jgi:hypothetical protein
MKNYIIAQKSQINLLVNEKSLLSQQLYFCYRKNIFQRNVVLVIFILSPFLYQWKNLILTVFEHGP